MLNVIMLNVVAPYLEGGLTPLSQTVGPLLITPWEAKMVYFETYFAESTKINHVNMLIPRLGDYRKIVLY
jgi:hypothetical protein